jgi:hypothetical protein
MIFIPPGIPGALQRAVVWARRKVTGTGRG